MIVLFYFISFFFALFPNETNAAIDLCELIKAKNCSGASKHSRKVSTPSYPTQTSTAYNNPATTSTDKGFGIETLYQANNPAIFNLTSGTGDAGIAIVNSKQENTFFSNRIYELDDNYLKRRKNYQQYRHKKQILSFAIQPIKGKEGTVAIGAGFKYHPEIRRVNPAIGLASRLGPFNFGASFYQDDFYLNLKNHRHPTTKTPYTSVFNANSYQEQFDVVGYSAGLKLWRLNLDFASLRTKYKVYRKDTNINIYSSSLNLDPLILLFAIRNESSESPKYIDRKLKDKRTETSQFGGIQIAPTQFLLLGVHYNYFLLNEFSFMGTIFF